MDTKETKDLLELVKMLAVIVGVALAILVLPTLVLALTGRHVAAAIVGTATGMALLGGLLVLANRAGAKQARDTMTIGAQIALMAATSRDRSDDRQAAAMSGVFRAGASMARVERNAGSPPALPPPSQLPGWLPAVDEFAEVVDNDTGEMIGSWND